MIAGVAQAMNLADSVDTVRIWSLPPPSPKLPNRNEYVFSLNDDDDVENGGCKEADHKHISKEERLAEQKKREALVRLAKLMHRYGSPVHRSEFNLVYCAKRWNVNAQFCGVPWSPFSYSFSIAKFVANFLWRPRPLSREESNSYLPYGTGFKL